MTFDYFKLINSITIELKCSLSESIRLIMLCAYCIHHGYKSIEDGVMNDNLAHALYYRLHNIYNFSREKESRFSEILYMEMCTQLKINPYAEVIETLFEQWNLMAGRGQRESGMPKEIAQLSAHLMKDWKEKDIFNPYAGFASFGIFCPHASYHGEDLNIDVATLAKLRLDAHGMSINDVEVADSTRFEWLGGNVMLAMPPFADKLVDKANSFVNFSNFKIHNSLEFLIAQFTALPGLRKAILVTPTGFSYQIGGYKILREALLDQNLIDSIIELPSNILYGTSIPCSLLVLDKDKSNQDVKIVDARECFCQHSKSIRILDIKKCVESITSENTALNMSTSDILKDNGNLSYDFYKRSQLVYPDTYKKYSLDNLICRTFADSRHGDENGRVITISNLPFTPFTGEIKIEDLEISSVAGLAKISHPCIVMSTIGQARAAICPASQDNPIYLKPNIIAWDLLMYDLVDANYLCLELNKISAYGTYANRIRVNDIIKMDIGLPSKEEQTAIFTEAKKAYTLAKAEELGLTEIIQSMKAEYINNVRNRKHDMAPYMRQLSSGFKLIKTYINREDYASIKNVIARQENAFKRLQELVNILSNEDEFGNPEIVNIDEFLSELENSPYDKVNYKILYDTDNPALEALGLPFHTSNSDNGMSDNAGTTSNREPLNLWVNIGKLDLKRVVDNIIANAIHHGFVDKNRTDYCIWITLSADTHKGTFIINFTNNGLPFPEGLTKERYGMLGEKAGKTGRNGKGGYIVRSIVEHFGGGYDILTGNETSTVRISLPIANLDENETL